MLEDSTFLPLVKESLLGTYSLYNTFGVNIRVNIIDISVFTTEALGRVQISLRSFVPVDFNCPNVPNSS